MKMFRCAKALGVLVLSLFVISCAADIQKSKGAGNGSSNQGGPTGVLTCVSPCQNENNTPAVIEANFGNQQKIRVKHAVSGGTPLPDRKVKFQVRTQDASGVSVSARTARTNKQGIASTTVRAGQTAGSAKVVVTVPNRDVPPLEWVVAVSSKNRASYNVNLKYDGQFDINPVVVKIYDQDRYTCQNAQRELRIKRNNVSNASPPATALAQKTANVTTGAQFPVVAFPDRQNGNAFTVVAEGKLRSNDRVQVAFGCKDGNPPIQSGQGVNIDLELTDHVPNVVGQYELTNNFNIKKGLPPLVRTVINLVGRLASDPGSFIFGCPDDPAPSGACADSAGADGLLDLFLNLLPQDSGFRQSIDSFLDLNIANSTLRGIVNAIAKDWIENNAPDWVGQSINITSDIFETLKSFGVEGTMQINKVKLTDNGTAIIPKQYTENGEQKPGGVQSWDTFVVKWTGRCAESTAPGSENREACSVRKFGPGAMGTGTDVIRGTFGGEVLTSQQQPPHLKIGKHSLNVSYGAIALTIIERAILPIVFGDSCGPNNSAPCNSLDLILRKLLDCSNFAQRVTSSAGNSREIVRNLCNELINKASTELRKYAVDKLVAEGGDNIRVGTPAGKPCRLYQPAPYPGQNWPGFPLPFVDKLGQEPRKKQCDWNLDLTIGDSSFQIPGRFYGTRID